MVYRTTSTKTLQVLAYGICTEIFTTTPPNVEQQLNSLEIYWRLEVDSDLKARYTYVHSKIDTGGRAETRLSWNITDIK